MNEKPDISGWTVVDGPRVPSGMCDMIFVASCAMEAFTAVRQLRGTNRVTTLNKKPDAIFGVTQHDCEKGDDVVVRISGVTRLRQLWRHR